MKDINNLNVNLNMNTPYHLAETLLVNQNKNAYSYFKVFTTLLIIVILIYDFLLFLELNLFYYKSSSLYYSINLKVFFYTFIDIIGLILLIIFCLLSKTRNEFIKIIASNKSDLSPNKDSSIHDTIRIGFKILASFLFLLIIITLPGTINHFWLIPNFLKTYQNFETTILFTHPCKR